MIRRVAFVILCATALSSSDMAAQKPTDHEVIYVLRSIREQKVPAGDWCTAARAGFDPLPKDAERFFSFWTIKTAPDDGHVVETKGAEAAQMHACFGATSERPRLNFYAEVTLGSVSFIGKGECTAVMIDVPEPGLIPAQCRLVLSGLRAPYVGGLLTTNTLTSRSAFGGSTDPAGYTQASIATIRLWKAR